MREEIKFSESAGRTIEAVRYSKYLAKSLVTFTDGTFACIGVDPGFEPGDEELRDDSFNRHGFSEEELEELSVMSIEEIEVEKKAEYERAARLRTESDMRRYLELKKQFGA